MQFIKSHFITIIGVLIGLAAGYVYWHQVGCLSGTCPITSSPVNSSLYGAIMVGLVFNMFQNKKNKN
jgi:xanthine/uracil permease